MFIMYLVPLPESFSLCALGEAPQDGEDDDNGALNFNESENSRPAGPTGRSGFYRE